MTVEVKICGVRDAAILDAAVSAGADLIGLVFFDKSPRNLTVAEAAALAARARGRVRTVAVFVDPDGAFIDEVTASVRPDVLQFHGSESPEHLAAVKERTGRLVFKAISVGEAADVARALAYERIADRVLFDSKVQGSAALPGGNGVAFDWHVLKTAPKPIALSGGLNPGNVADAIRLTGASLVDVSSGVETAPGQKDEGLISQFIRAARLAAPRQEKAS